MILIQFQFQQCHIYTVIWQNKLECSQFTQVVTVESGWCILACANWHKNKAVHVCLSVLYTSDRKLGGTWEQLRLEEQVAGMTYMYINMHEKWTISPWKASLIPCSPPPEFVTCTASDYGNQCGGIRLIKPPTAQDICANTRPHQLWGGDQMWKVVFLRPHPTSIFNCRKQDGDWEWGYIYDQYRFQVKNNIHKPEICELHTLNCSNYQYINGVFWKFIIQCHLKHDEVVRGERGYFIFSVPCFCHDGV